jgi:hypothetical protein
MTFNVFKKRVVIYVQPIFDNFETTFFSFFFLLCDKNNREIKRESKNTMWVWKKDLSKKLSKFRCTNIGSIKKSILLNGAPETLFKDFI